MAPQLGQYNLQDALNRALPVFGRMKFGDWVNNVTNFINGAAAQADVSIALDSGAAAMASGTLTVAGSVADGDFFRLTFVDASLPPLVTPGIRLGPIPIVTADTVTTIAAKVAVAINASPILLNLGFVATSAVGVVTVKVPGTAGNALVMTAQLSAGAVITVTPVNPTGGTGAVASRNVTNYAIPPLSGVP